jgi:hypothetical protein
VSVVSKIKTAGLLALTAIVITLISFVFTADKKTEQPRHISSDSQTNLRHTSNSAVAGASTTKAVDTTPTPTVPVPPAPKANGTAAIKRAPILPAPTVPSPTPIPTPSPEEQEPDTPQAAGITGPYSYSLEAGVTSVTLSFTVKGDKKYTWEPSTAAHWEGETWDTEPEVYATVLGGTKATTYTDDHLNFTLTALKDVAPGNYKVSFKVKLKTKILEVPIQVTVTAPAPPVVGIVPLRYAAYIVLG